jgi:hypothetical protein
VEVCFPALPDPCARETYFGSNIGAKGHDSKSFGSGTPNRNNSSKRLYTASMPSLARGRTCELDVGDESLRDIRKEKTYWITLHHGQSLMGRFLILF